MFEKHRNNKLLPTGDSSAARQTDNLGMSASTSSAAGRVAVIGPKIHINGDISGEENLFVEGKVDGKICLDAHQVEIGQCGQVNANISAKVIKVAGEICGDLSATEKVVISHTGNVHGNIVAPRMTLEDGAIFKGSIDMDPGEPAKPEVSQVLKSTAAKPMQKTAGATRAAKPEKSKENHSYTLNGS